MVMCLTRIKARSMRLEVDGRAGDHVARGIGDAGLVLEVVICCGQC